MKNAMVKATTLALVIVHQLDVRNFEYNGFFGSLHPGYAEYKAKFVQWTNDPGIALCECSDGKSRFIPSFAIERNKECAVKHLPKQDFSNKVMFGVPSTS